MPLRNPVMWSHMQQMMDGGMVWAWASAVRFGRLPVGGMGLGSLMILILVVLVIAVLIKYIFFQ
jgi:hypothetical protein